MQNYCRVADNVMGEQKAPKPPRARVGGGGGGQRGARKGDPHQLENVDAGPMESDPGDLGRWVGACLLQCSGLASVFGQGMIC